MMAHGIVPNFLTRLSSQWHLSRAACLEVASNTCVIFLPKKQPNRSQPSPPQNIAPHFALDMLPAPPQKRRETQKEHKPLELAGCFLRQLFSGQTNRGSRGSQLAGRQRDSGSCRPEGLHRPGDHSPHFRFTPGFVGKTKKAPSTKTGETLRRVE